MINQVIITIYYEFRIFTKNELIIKFLSHMNKALLSFYICNPISRKFNKQMMIIRKNKYRNNCYSLKSVMK